MSKRDPIEVARVHVEKALELVSREVFDQLVYEWQRRQPVSQPAPTPAARVPTRAQLLADEDCPICHQPGYRDAPDLALMQATCSACGWHYTDRRPPATCEDCGSTLTHVVGPNVRAVVCAVCDPDSSALDDDDDDD